MGHYFSEMASPTDEELKERRKNYEAIKSAVREGVVAGIQAGKNSVGLDRDGMYAKPVKVAPIVNRIMRDIW